MTVRWLVALAPLALSVPMPADACSCMATPSPCARFVETGATIFVGTTMSKAPVDLALDGVVAILSPRDRPMPSTSRGTLFTFRIDEWIQGERPGRDVRVASDGGSCSYPFRIGTSYLVYAYPGSDVLRVIMCSRTGPLAWRRDDLALLREMRAGPLRPRLAGSLRAVATPLTGWYAHERTTGPVPGVRIVAEGAGGRLEAVTDREGIFSFGPVAPGEYRVRADVPAGAAVQGPAWQRVTVDACLGEIGLAMARTRLAGTVRTVEGAVTMPVQVTAVTVGPGRAPAVGSRVFTYSDRSGQWDFWGLPAGRYLIGVNVFSPPTPQSPWPPTWHGGAAEVSEARIIEVADAVSPLIDLRLPAPLASRTVDGVVLDPAGRPVKGANVGLYDRADKRDLASTATTDATGRFAIARLPDRQYDIEVRLSILGEPSRRVRRRLPDSPAAQPIRIVLGTPR